MTNLNTVIRASVYTISIAIVMYLAYKLGLELWCLAYPYL